MDGMKLCSKCRQLKPLEEFYKQASSVDGLQAWCKGCYRQRDRDSYAADPEAAHKKLKAWRAARKAADPEGWKRYVKDTALRSTYGISLQDWEDMYDAQHGRCAICLESFGDEQPHVDHSAKTGQVRGLLCRLCNVGVGHFRENPNYLRRAITYLIEAPSEQPDAEAIKAQIKGGD
jgi:hypothetical protein